MDDRLNLACERAVDEFETELLANNPFKDLQIIVSGQQLLTAHEEGFRRGWVMGREAATTPSPTASGLE